MEATIAGRRPVELAGYAVGVLLIVSGLVHFGVFLVDGGGWAGPVSWRKPTTFGLSFGLTLITVVWIASYLELRPRARTLLLGVFTADCVLEVAGITLQAWRGEPSHFNTTTAINRTVAYSLAAGGLILVVTLTWLAVIAFRGRIRGGPDLRLALRAGFAFLLLALATGVAMIARGTTLVRTGHEQQAYETAGSLKPVHGVTLHAILVLPLLAEATRLLGWTDERRLRTVQIGTGLYIVTTLIAAGIALS